MNEWLRHPAERDLPEAGHRLLKEFVMTEIHNQSRRRLRRPLTLAGAGALAATALAIAVPAVLDGAPSAAAYTITGNPDGTITVKIYEAKDPQGLQAALRSRGFNAIVDYVPDGKKCQGPRSSTWVPGVQLAHPQTPEEEGDGAGFRIDPSPVQPGQTAVLEFFVKEIGGTVAEAGVSAMVSAGPVAECTLVDRD